jgi:DNA-binding transcriptional MerR regulator
MLTVNELAVQSGAPAHVVRYYTRIGLIEPFAQQDNGYRLFRPDDVGRLRFIRLAKQLGFTLNEIRRITRQAAMGETPCPDVRNIIKLRIVENRQKIDAMLQLQVRMEDALKTWDKMPDGMPDGHHVCYLIESFSDVEDAGAGGQH